MAINDKVRELIKQLQAKLTNYQKEITLIQSQVEALKLKSPPQQNKITEVEQELTSLQSKLLVCQQEKEALQQALDEKVKELENSNLTKEEKATAIIKLTESNRSELNSVNEKLEKVWASYTQQQNKIIEYLTHSCSACTSKSETIQDLTYVRNWLIGLVSLLLILLYRSHWPKKPQKKLKYDNLTRISKQ